MQCMCRVAVCTCGSTGVWLWPKKCLRLTGYRSSPITQCSFPPKCTSWWTCSRNNNRKWWIWNDRIRNWRQWSRTHNLGIPIDADPLPIDRPVPVPVPVPVQIQIKKIMYCDCETREKQVQTVWVFHKGQIRSLWKTCQTVTFSHKRFSYLRWLHLSRTYFVSSPHETKPQRKALLSIAACNIKWLDSGEIAEDIVICISELDQPRLDDYIFNTCHDVAEFMSLTNDDCGEEFQVLQCCTVRCL